MNKIVNRLNRVEGQIKGVKGMYRERRNCMDMVQQIAAARAALARVGRDLLTDEASQCAKSPRRQKDFDKVIKSLFDIS